MSSKLIILLFLQMNIYIQQFQTNLLKFHLIRPSETDFARLLAAFQY